MKLILGNLLMLISIIGVAISVYFFAKGQGGKECETPPSDANTNYTWGVVGMSVGVALFLVGFFLKLSS